MFLPASPGLRTTSFQAPRLQNEKIRGHGPSGDHHIVIARGVAVQDVLADEPQGIDVDVVRRVIDEPQIRMGDILVLLGPAGGDQPGLVEVDGDQA
jgi:hypothetical protein